MGRASRQKKIGGREQAITRRTTQQEPTPAAAPMLYDAPGLIAMLSGEHMRYTVVQQCLDHLLVPHGSSVEHVPGLCNVTENRNQIVKLLQPEHQWLWMLDDDQLFAPDCLIRLLTHLRRDDVDVVVPNVRARFYPYHPLAYGPPPEGQTRPATLALTPTDTGLTPIHAAGCGGMLIRRRVLDRLPAPWFEHGQLGIASDLDEDRWFCLKARAAGFGVFCDLDTAMGHMIAAAVWPEYIAGAGWQRVRMQMLPGGCAPWPALAGAISEHATPVTTATRPPR